MKIKKLQKFLHNHNIDIALFFDCDPNFSFFSGVCIEHGCLVVPVSGRASLFVPAYEIPHVSQFTTAKVVESEKDFLRQIHELFPAKRIGIYPAKTAYSMIQWILDLWNCELVSIDDICKELRCFKLRDEISRIVKACAFTDLIFNDLMARIDVFRTEKDISVFLKARMAELGVEPSFSPVVATGTNASISHHIPTDTKLCGFTVVDFGVVYRNFCSDMTRTLFFGTPSSVQYNLFNQVLDVQNKCIELVKPGTEFDYLDSFAHDKLGKGMVHRIGHSVGVEVHDVHPKPWILDNGNVLAVEPGLYEQNKYGIRIEDVVLVRDGPVLLTKSPRKLFVIR